MRNIKKMICIVCVLALIAALAGCTSAPAKESVAPTDAAAATPETEAAEPVAEEPAAEEPAMEEPAAATEAVASSDGYELALVTDVGTIDDKSFNQGAWEGVKQYAEENGKTFKYYQPAEKTDDAYIETINLAIKGGAKVVVCPGFLFSNAVGVSQKANPDVNFILLDADPTDPDTGETLVADNTYAVHWAEEQPGFLAGYAAVKEGNTKLGFMGGMAVPAVVRYGYGFVQGAEFAAKEMGIEEVSIRYHYMGNFDASPEAQALAASWYQDGTQVIFGCGGGVGNSVMAAAEAGGGKVIGVDVDQSGESETVITSAMKYLQKAVYDGISNYFAETFPGGQAVTLTVETGDVGLPSDFSRFTTFTQADYDAIYAKLVADEGGVRTSIKTDVDASGQEIKSAADLGTTIAKVDVIS